MVAFARAVQSLFTGFCSIWVLEKVKNEETGRTEETARLYGENIPCRLSFSARSAVARGPVAAKRGPGMEVEHQTKLLLAPEIVVPPGSRVVVVQNGVTREYRQSGIPAVYRAHQELRLVSEQRWA